MINSSTYTWWQNRVQSAAAPIQGGGSVTPGTSTIQTLMNNLWLDLKRGSDEPDLIVSSNEYYNYYEESLTQYKRYTPEADGADGGLIALKYKSADVFADGGNKGGGIPSAHMYFLNTDFLEICVHKDANLTEAGKKMSVNQDGEIIPYLWQGNLVVSQRSLQGILKA